MCARVIPTMSTSPSVIAYRAVATSAIRAAWKIGRFTRSRNLPANWSAGPMGVPRPGMTCEIASSVAIEPLTMLMKSIVPVAASVRAISTPSASVSPPSTSSPPVIRMPTMKSDPTFARIASSTSIEKRIRFASDPPYASERLLTSGDQNWSRRWPYASSSSPSSPPSLHRRAASAYDATTRRISASSIAFGNDRWAGSRTDDDEMVGSQSPSSQTVRRPRWVSWTIVAAPCACIRSASCRKYGMMSSSPAYELPEDRWRIRRDIRRPAEHRQGDAALRLLLLVELVAQFRLGVLGVGRLMRRAHDPVPEREVPELERLEERIGRGRHTRVHVGRPGA